MRLSHKGLILVGVPLLMTVIITGSMYWLLLQEDQRRAVDIQQKQIASNGVHSMLVLIDLMFVADLVLGGKDPSIEQRFSTDISSLKERFKHDFRELNSMQVGETPASRAAATRAAQIEILAQQSLEQIRDLIRGMKGKTDNQSLMERFHQQRHNLVLTSYEVALQASGLLDAARRDVESNSITSRQEFETQLHTLLALVGLSIFTAAILARWLVYDVAERLKVIVDNTVRMSGGKQLNQPLRGNDEIAALDKRFHAMCSATREAMEREAALFEDAPDAIFVLDGNLGIVAANPAFERMFSVLAEDALHEQLSSLVVADDQDKLSQLLGSLGPKNQISSVEFKIDRADAAVVHVTCSLYWSEMDGAIYGIVHDITQKKTIEEAKEQFLAMVTHDLRSPLSSIAGTFEVLSQDHSKLPPPAAQRIGEIRPNVQRLLSLVNNLLDMDKLEAGKMQLIRETVSVREMIERALEDVHVLASARNMRLSIECSAANFYLDEERVIQVIINLVSNAIKHSPADSTITVRAFIDDRKYLHIAVIDQGRGIPASQITKIFDRFKQAYDSDSKSGTGLGLAICKHIVQEHGGSINATSELGKGSCFEFILPGLETSVEPAVPFQKDVPKVAGERQGEHIEAHASQTAGGKKTHRLRLSNMRLSVKCLILVAIPLSIELALAAFLCPLLSASFEEEQRQQHQKLVSTTGAELLLNHLLLGFSMSLRPPEKSWAAFVTYADNAEALKTEFKHLTSRDPDVVQQLKDIEPFFQTVDTFTVRAEKIIHQFGVNETALGAAYFGRRGLTEMAAAGSPAFSKLIEQASGKADESPAKLRRIRQQQGMIMLAGLGASVLFSILCSLAFGRDITSRLRQIETNMQLYEDGEDLLPALSGTDEVAKLDAYFRTMAMSLREARRKEAAVLDNSQDVMCSLSDDGKILRINPIVERLWGYNRHDLTNTSLYQLLVHAQTFQKALTDVCAVGETKTVEAAVICADSRTRDIEWSIARSKRTGGVVAIAYDVTERKELERMKQEFLDMVSHDLRTPLTAVSANTEMIEGGMFGPLAEPTARMLQAVIRSCDRLLALIENLLAIRKLESGEMPLELENVDARLILEQSADALATLAEKKNIRVDISDGPALSIHADRTRMVQVVINLLSNAIKFSPDNSTICLTAQPVEQFIELAVKDNGRGIPQEQIGALFERFRQVEARDGLPGRGTGLGLPICKQIVEQHHGQILVESEAGKGTTFIVRIPTGVRNPESQDTVDSRRG